MTDQEQQRVRRFLGVVGLALLLGVFLPGPAARAVTVYYFSADQSFTPTAGPNASQGVYPGDLLSSDGHVVMRNSALLAPFLPLEDLADFGLDAVFVRPCGEVLFSVTHGFHAGALGNAYVSPGDLVSSAGTVLRTNSALTSRLGIMPIVPDLGLDAVDRTPTGEILFSTEQGIFSETLGPLHHGDLLSEKGKIVCTYQDLMRNFQSPIQAYDYGLDAVHRLPSGEVLFSTRESFTATAGPNANKVVSPGDLLSSTGRVVMKNADLLAPFFGGASKVPKDCGLDALWAILDAGPTAVDNQDGSVYCGWEYDLQNGRGSLLIENVGPTTWTRFTWPVAGLLTLTGPGGAWQSAYDPATGLVALSGSLAHGDSVSVDFTFDAARKVIGHGNLDYSGGAASGTLGDIAVVAPEPASLSLLVLGACLVLGRRRR